MSLDPRPTFEGKAEPIESLEALTDDLRYGSRPSLRVVVGETTVSVQTRPGDKAPWSDPIVLRPA